MGGFIKKDFSLSPGLQYSGSIGVLIISAARRCRGLLALAVPVLLCALAIPAFVAPHWSPTLCSAGAIAPGLWGVLPVVLRGERMEPLALSGVFPGRAGCVPLPSRAPFPSCRAWTRSSHRISRDFQTRQTKPGVDSGPGDAAPPARRVPPLTLNFSRVFGASGRCDVMLSRLCRAPG